MKVNNLCARARIWWRREIRPLLVLAIVVFSIRSSFADWSDVPTGSMKPTILEGDRVFVNKVAYDLKVPFTTVHLAEWADPKRGDIVVFYSPQNEQRLIKRVIGLPGDIIELRDNRLIINGEVIKYSAGSETLARDLSSVDRKNLVVGSEQLAQHSHAVAAIPTVSAMRNFGPYQVPEKHYFMMGDNRDDSLDSRYFGAVERRRILGHATAVALSFDRNHYWQPRWHRFFSSFDRDDTSQE